MARPSTLQTIGQTTSVWAVMENNTHNEHIHCKQTPAGARLVVLSQRNIAVFQGSIGMYVKSLSARVIKKGILYI